MDESICGTGGINIAREETRNGRMSLLFFNWGYVFLYGDDKLIRFGLGGIELWEKNSLMCL